MELNGCYYTETPAADLSDVKVINKLMAYGDSFEVDLGPTAKAKLIDEIISRFNFVPTLEYKCHNCGGVLEMKATEHIFRCPFCNSVYAVGTQLKNDGR